MYSNLGPGLLESVYEEALIYELKSIGLKVEEQKPVEVVYDGHVLHSELRLDLLVEDVVILELKSVEELKKVHYKQLHTYLKLSNKRVGLLVNFNVDNIFDGIKRIINSV